MAERYLRISEVAQRTTLSRSAIYVAISEGRFPKPVRLSPRHVAWREANIDKWIVETSERKHD